MADRQMSEERTSRRKTSGGQPSQVTQGQMSQRPSSRYKISRDPSSQGQTSQGQVNQRPMSQGQMSQGQMSQGQMSQGQMSQGKMSQSQMSQGQMSQGKKSQSQMSQGQMSQGQMSQGQMSQGQMSKAGKFSQGQSHPGGPGSGTGSEIYPNDQAQTEYGTSAPNFPSHEGPVIEATDTWWRVTFDCAGLDRRDVEGKTRRFQIGREQIVVQARKSAKWKNDQKRGKEGVRLSQIVSVPSYVRPSSLEADYKGSGDNFQVVVSGFTEQQWRPPAMGPQE
ncbi:uncharacterized protein LOC142357850, partial [Convolutriloba macropyga]|uniref:uncharacterized protein LOC142357850 n=1 Tax=Convolutriloba macropyga TaxID=536237 RepID=UPI003F51E5BC